MDRLFDVLARLASAAVLAAAMVVAPGSGVGVAAARAVDCPTGPVTAAKLAAMEYGTGADCYGGRLLTFRAFVPRPDGLGGTNASVLFPQWLDDWLGSPVLLSSGPGTAWVTAFVPPALGHCSFSPMGSTCPFKPYAHRWVTVSAHFDAPVATTCYYSEHPSGPGFSRKAARAECRQKLVVLAVGPDALPSTDAVATGPDDPSTNPEGTLDDHHPACPPPPVTIAKLVHLDVPGHTCYGNQTLVFRAFVAPPCDECGGTSDLVIAPRWLDGLQGSSVNLSAVKEGPQVAAYVPPALGRCPLEDDSTCPFRPYRHQWATIRAQYDAPVAQTCRYAEKPAGGGFTKADAVAECRAKLVVLSVGPDSGPSTDTIALGPAISGPAPRHAPLGLWVGLFAAVTLLLVARRRSRR